MSEPLRVELNRESVHAIDAPESFTSEGPFHVELHNAGGAVHVHLHLDDDLSRVSRLDDVNHYVEEGATKRVPVGVRPNRNPTTGRLKIASGYGTEEAYVDLTVVPKSNRTADTGRERIQRGGSVSGSGRGASDSPQGGTTPTREKIDGTTATREETDGTTGPDRTTSTDPSPTDDRSGGTDRRTSPEGTATADGTGATNRASPTDPDDGGTTDARTSPTVRAASDNSRSRWGTLSDATRLDSLPNAVSAVWRESPEAVTFLALAVVAIIVGVGAIVVVSDVLLALVVAAVVTGAVAVAGWLLLQ